MVNDYNRSPQEVLEELHTSPLGLTAAEAAARLAAHGPNKLKEAEKPSLLRRFLAQLKDPMLLMLMAGGVACFGGGCWLAVRRKRQSGEEPPWDWRKR